MKTAILLHGTAGTPTNFWFPWLKAELENEGYYVWAPELPNATEANLTEWTHFVNENAPYAEDETVLIGHSAGVPLILSFLNQTPHTYNRAIMVAGFCKPLEGMSENHQTLPQHLDWKRIKKHCKSFCFVHSTNDPWGCTPAQGEYMQNKLGGTLAICEGAGHFGSATFNQPCRKLPLAKALVLMGEE